MQKTLSHPFVKLVFKAQFILALIIYATLSLMTLPSSGNQLPFDVLHVIGNIILYASAWVALSPQHSLGKIYVFILPYSLSVEILQTLNPNRYTDIADMAANILGLTIGLLLCACINKCLLAPHKS